MLYCFCPRHPCMSVGLQFRIQRVLQGWLFLHPVCGGKGPMLFMLSQSGTWPTNKGDPVDEKTSPQHYWCGQNLIPKNGNNKPCNCIPLYGSLFLICLMSVVVEIWIIWFRCWCILLLNHMFGETCNVFIHTCPELSNKLFGWSHRFTEISWKSMSSTLWGVYSKPWKKKHPAQLPWLSKIQSSWPSWVCTSNESLLEMLCKQVNK